MKLLALAGLLVLVFFAVLSIHQLLHTPSGDPTPTPKIRFFEQRPAGLGFGFQDPRPMLSK